MVTLGYAIANPTYKNYESQGGFGLIVFEGEFICAAGFNGLRN